MKSFLSKFLFRLTISLVLSIPFTLMSISIFEFDEQLYQSFYGSDFYQGRQTRLADDSKLLAGIQNTVQWFDSKTLKQLSFGRAVSCRSGKVRRTIGDAENSYFSEEQEREFCRAIHFGKTLFEHKAHLFLKMPKTYDEFIGASGKLQRLFNGEKPFVWYFLKQGNRCISLQVPEAKLADIMNREDSSGLKTSFNNYLFCGFTILFLTLSSRFGSFSNWILTGLCMLYLLIAYLTSEGYRYRVLKDARKLRDIDHSQLQKLNSQVKGSFDQYCLSRAEAWRKGEWGVAATSKVNSKQGFISFNKDLRIELKGFDSSLFRNMLVEFSPNIIIKDLPEVFSSREEIRSLLQMESSIVGFDFRELEQAVNIENKGKLQLLSLGEGSYFLFDSVGTGTDYRLNIQIIPIQDLAKDFEIQLKENSSAKFERLVFREKLNRFKLDLSYDPVKGLSIYAMDTPWYSTQRELSYTSNSIPELIKSRSNSLLRQLSLLAVLYLFTILFLKYWLFRGFTQLQHSLSQLNDVGKSREMRPFLLALNFKDIADSFNELRVALIEKEELRPYLETKLLQIASEGEIRREGVVLFSDIRSFTSISEGMSSEEIVHMLNEYFEIWMDVSNKYQGLIERFIGDAVVLLFLEDDLKGSAQKALACCLEMRVEMERIQAKRRELGLVVYENGLGLSASSLHIKAIGTSPRILYAHGEAVLEAEELEAKTKQTQSKIACDDKVKGLLEGEALFIPLTGGGHEVQCLEE